jgi:hypothetical protein
MSLLFLACIQRNDREKELIWNLNKKIQLTTFEKVNKKNNNLNFDSFRKQYKFISIVYLKNGCNKCYIDFIKWHKKIKSLVQNYNYTILFIIEG